MRLRKIQGADEAVESHARCLKPEDCLPGQWEQMLGNDHPIQLEIGMGKGKFIMTLAERNPEINYIGMERYPSVLYRGLQKYDENPLENLWFLCFDAEKICDIFGEGEIDRIYLNFSDPWPKARHAKRRLTSRNFLHRYDRILKPDGQIEFKTDNRELFDFSLEEVREAGWKTDLMTRDLHHDPVMNQDNIMTEYEKKFSQLGNHICKMVISRNK